MSLSTHTEATALAPSNHRKWKERSSATGRLPSGQRFSPRFSPPGGAAHLCCSKARESRIVCPSGLHSASNWTPSFRLTASTASLSFANNIRSHNCDGRFGPQHSLFRSFVPVCMVPPVLPVRHPVPQATYSVPLSPDPHASSTMLLVFSHRLASYKGGRHRILFRSRTSHLAPVPNPPDVHTCLHDIGACPVRSGCKLLGIVELALMHACS